MLVNIPNFKSIDAKLKKLCWDHLCKVDNYTREKWKFWRQKLISNFLFWSSFIWLQENCDKMISWKLNNHKVFNKYICSLMSIQKEFWLSRLLLCQRLPNRGETVSLLCGFWGDLLRTHPKRHEFFSSTHQSLRKDNNSSHHILSLEHGPKSSNLKDFGGLSVFILLRQQGLSHQGYGSGRRLRLLWLHFRQLRKAD